MPKLIFSFLVAVLLVVSCSDDATGPSEEGTPPDTTWEHSVTLEARVLNTVPDPSYSIHWLENGEETYEHYQDSLWWHSFEGHSGDSLWVLATSFGEEWLLVTIYVDGTWCESSGPTMEPGTVECSYVIP